MEGEGEREEEVAAEWLVRPPISATALPSLILFGGVGPWAESACLGEQKST